MRAKPSSQGHDVIDRYFHLCFRLINKLTDQVVWQNEYEII